MGEGYVVLDIDVKNRAPGLDSWRSLTDEAKKEILTKTIITPSCGLHLYLRTPLFLKTRHSFRPGLDFQASGSYVVGPNSVIDRKTYQESISEIAELPSWLADLLATSPIDSGKAEPIDCSPDEPSTVAVLIQSINPDITYGDWRDVIFAGINLLGMGEDTVAMLRNWSKESSKFNDREFNKVVHSHDPSWLEKVGFSRLEALSRAFPKKIVELPFHPDAVELFELALTIAVNRLKKFGNEPSGTHLEGVRMVVQALAHGLFMEDQFRIAIPLETGAGKTNAIVAVAKAIQDLHLDKAVLISAERVEQLDDLRKDMIEEGVYPEAVGLFHTKDDVPSIKESELSTTRFLLAAHNGLKSHSKRDRSNRLLTYMGRPRDGIWWDESLERSKGMSLARTTVMQAIGSWLGGYHAKCLEGKIGSPAFVEFEAFLQGSEVELKGPKDNVFRIPELTLDADSYLCVINTIETSFLNREALSALVRYSRRGEVRLLKLSDGHALIQFIITIGDDFTKMVILDASSRIKEFVRYDKTIDVFDTPISKDYSTVKIFWGNIRSSKEAFAAGRKGEDWNVDSSNHLKKFLDELEHITDIEIPAGESLLILCHREAKATIQTWSNERPSTRRIEVLGWGEHKASNKYSDIKYVAIVGVLYRDNKELAASIIGQTGDLDYRAINFDKEVKRTQMSEQADLLYQGISRGNSRKMIDGKAGEQTIYLFHPAKDWTGSIPGGYSVKTLLEQVMPGVVFEERKPKHLSDPLRKNSIDAADLGDKIVDFLASNPDNQIKIRDVLAAVAPELNSNDREWRKAKAYANRKLVGWEAQGLKFVKKDVARID